jgi:predicted transcriptional regulator of viral defense system
MAQNTDSFQKLFKTAKEQQGFFTTRQAVAAGYSEKNHAFHVGRKTWIREERGIYRLSQFPESDDADLILWALWSRDRKGKTQGVYSHQTALRIHELTDQNPPKLHMTVPPTFRRSVPIPKILVLHRGVLDPKDSEIKKGYTVTKVKRTLEDLSQEGAVSEEVIRQGLEEGIRRGVLTLREFHKSPVLSKMSTKVRRMAAGERRLNSNGF